LTYDQGREMAPHKKLTEHTGVVVYFCDQHGPWQRGSNENTNGLVRQYLPKGTDLLVYSQEQLDAIADQIIGRLRKGPGVRSPLADYRELLLNSRQHSTWQSPAPRCQAGTSCRGRAAGGDRQRGRLGQPPQGGQAQQQTDEGSLDVFHVT
jgi:hypothetical protein